MQNFYDDITVLGVMHAQTISGVLAEETRAPLDARIDELLLSLNAAHDNLANSLCVQQDALSAEQTIIADLVEKYNKAIEVINNLAERVTALEANYDPTVIK